MQQEDGITFKGFIRVTMNLTRPVSIGNSNDKEEKASFYIDKVVKNSIFLKNKLYVVMRSLFMLERCYY